jgi:hypothetical protein
MKRITPLLFFAVTVLGACAAKGVATDANVPASISRPAPTLPDLNDPTVRHRFVCSFAPGYFAPTPPTSLAANPECESANHTNP